MAEWVVRFSRPVIYQPDHPIAQREIAVMLVNAPTAAAASMHAIRVTVGETEILSVLPPDADAAGVDAARAAEPPPPPPPAADQDASFFMAPEEDLRGGP